MKQTSKTKEQLISEQQRRIAVASLKNEVEFLELRARQRDALRTLEEYSGQDHVYALMNIEIGVMDTNPELAASILSVRNNYLTMFKFPEEKYLSILNEQTQNRGTQLNKQPVGNPSDQLHAIGEELKDRDIPASDDIHVDLPFVDDSQTDGVPAPEITATTPEVTEAETAIPAENQ